MCIAQAPRDSGMIGILAAIMAAAALLGASVRDFVGLPDWVVIAAVGAAIIGLAVFENRAAHRAGINPWAKATNLTLTYFAYRYGAGLIVILLWDYFPWQADPHLAYKFHVGGVRENLLSASLLVAIGILGLFVGLRIPVERVIRAIPKPGWIVDEGTFPYTLILYTPIGLGTLLFSAAAPPALKFPVYVLGSVTYPLITIAAYWWARARTLREKRVWLLYLCLVCGIALVHGLMTGLLGNMLFPPMCAVLGYAIVKRNIPWKTLIATGLVAFTFVFPLLSMYKRVYFESKGLSIGQRIQVVTQRFASGGWRLGFESTCERFLGRMASDDMVAVFLRAYPEPIPFLQGESLRDEMASLTPRFINPNKPPPVGSSSAYNQYAAQLGLVQFGGDSSLALDAVTEYYINFGAVGVLLLCIAHGVCVRLAGAFLAGRLNQPLAGAIQSGLLLTNFDVLGLGQAFVFQVKVLPIWLGILYLLSRKWLPDKT